MSLLHGALRCLYTAHTHANVYNWFCRFCLSYRYLFPLLPIHCVAHSMHRRLILFIFIFLALWSWDNADDDDVDDGDEVYGRRCREWSEHNFKWREKKQKKNKKLEKIASTAMIGRWFVVIFLPRHGLPHSIEHVFHTINYNYKIQSARMCKGLKISAVSALHTLRRLSQAGVRAVEIVYVIVFLYSIRRRFCYDMRSEHVTQGLLHS